MKNRDQLLKMKKKGLLCLGKCKLETSLFDNTYTYFINICNNLKKYSLFKMNNLIYPSNEAPYATRVQ